jgi:hypothetical protein
MIGLELPAMRAFRRINPRRSLSAIIAAVLAFGLLHGPSMMLAKAAPANADCHAQTASDPAGHAHGVDDEYLAVGADNDELVADEGSASPRASACPFANIAAISSPQPAATLLGQSTPLVGTEPAALVSAIIDRPDPPPRRAA